MPKHILILSSKPEVYQRLCDTLEPQGYSLAEVSSSASAEEVLQTINQDKPNLVILSPGTAELKGQYYDVVKQLGPETRNTDPRLIVLSGEGVQGGTHGVATFPDMYLNDRFVPAELLAYVRRLIGPAEE